MKAAQISRYGGKNVVEINDNAPMPKPSGDMVVVQTKAAGVNPADWKIREGLMQNMAPLAFPATLGGDFAGIVIEAGQRVTKFRKGDEVYGYASALSGSSGAFAEYISVPQDKIAKKPKRLDHSQAAALPLAGISAMDVIMNKIKPSKGQKILIHGGAGGIGSIAIQIAKHTGAYVATTVGSEDINFARGLGADLVIDYKTQDFEKILNGYDAVFDTVGGDTLKKSYSVLKKGGILVTMVGQNDPELMNRYDVKFESEYTAMAISTESLNALAELADQGVISVHIDESFPLDETREAIDYQRTGHPTGKIIVDV